MARAADPTAASQLPSQSPIQPPTPAPPPAVGGYGQPCRAPAPPGGLAKGNLPVDVVTPCDGALLCVPYADKAKGGMCVCQDTQVAGVACGTNSVCAGQSSQTDTLENYTDNFFYALKGYTWGPGDFDPSKAPTDWKRLTDDKKVLSACASLCFADKKAAGSFLPSGDPKNNQCMCIDTPSGADNCLQHSGGVLVSKQWLPSSTKGAMCDKQVFASPTPALR
jgi:hypothetical protein